MTDGIIQKVMKKYYRRNCTDVIIVNELYNVEQELIEEIKQYIDGQDNALQYDLIGDNQE